MSNFLIAAYALQSDNLDKNVHLDYLCSMAQWPWVLDSFQQ